MQRTHLFSVYKDCDDNLQCTLGPTRATYDILITIYFRNDSENMLLFRTPRLQFSLRMNVKYDTRINGMRSVVGRSMDALNDVHSVQCTG